LLRRYDPTVFELGRPTARIRLEGAAEHASDVILDGRTAELEAAGRKRPDAILSADPETWRQMANDLRGGMPA